MMLQKQGKLGWRYNRPSRQIGFTLVELLLASIIGVLVVLISLSTFRAVNHNRRNARYYAQTMAYARYAMNQMRNDLANFYRCSDTKRMYLRGWQDKLDDYPADHLFFYMVSDRRIHEDVQEGERYEVEYAMGKSTRRKFTYLARHRTAVMEDGSKHDRGVMIRLARNLTALQFSYYNGQQWLRQWQLDSPPRLIRVNMTFSDPQNKKPDIVLSQEISLEPFPQQQSEGLDNANIPMAK